MSRANDCAFPPPNGVISLETGYGLTVREHFAGLAMQGLLGNADRQDAFHADRMAQVLAKDAVLYADALLAELAKPSPTKDMP